MAEAKLRQQWQLDPESVRALARGLHPNPFGVLGPHYSPEGHVIRAFLPGATKSRFTPLGPGASGNT
jgi:hypothetical protein